MELEIVYLILEWKGLTDVKSILHEFDNLLSVVYYLTHQNEQISNIVRSISKIRSAFNHTVFPLLTSKVFVFTEFLLTRII